MALSGIAVRSQMSKLCDSDEVGRYMSLLAIIQVLWPLVDSAIFTAIYTSTLSFYPSYEHLVAAVFSFYALCGFLGLRLSLASEERRPPTLPEQGVSPSVPEDKEEHLTQTSSQHSVSPNYQDHNSSPVDLKYDGQTSTSVNENTHL
ncbi:uncharacterized protein LOC121876280 [Homarus americanus]|uniref:uncharacterized protein LOC121876280 n=1 Tax=Homarus americanus TaxID=6706 RepID=UPI001C44C1F6|nr:uncharacterized protein LOC121876280 [Homarus americanus]